MHALTHTPPATLAPPLQWSVSVAWLLGHGYTPLTMCLGRYIFDGISLQEETLHTLIAVATHHVYKHVYITLPHTIVKPGKAVTNSC